MVSAGAAVWQLRLLLAARRRAVQRGRALLWNARLMDAARVLDAAAAPLVLSTDDSDASSSSSAATSASSSLRAFATRAGVAPAAAGKPLAAAGCAPASAEVGHDAAVQLVTRLPARSQVDAVSPRSSPPSSSSSSSSSTFSPGDSAPDADADGDDDAAAARAELGALLLAAAGSAAGGGSDHGPRGLVLPGPSLLPLGLRAAEGTDDVHDLDTQHHHADSSTTSDDDAVVVVETASVHDALARVLVLAVFARAEVAVMRALLTEQPEHGDEALAALARAAATAHAWAAVSAAARTVPLLVRSDKERSGGRGAAGAAAGGGGAAAAAAAAAAAESGLAGAYAALLAGDTAAAESRAAAVSSQQKEIGIAMVSGAAQRAGAAVASMLFRGWGSSQPAEPAEAAPVAAEEQEPAVQVHADVVRLLRESELLANAVHAQTTVVSSLFLIRGGNLVQAGLSIRSAWKELQQCDAGRSALAAERPGARPDPDVDSSLNFSTGGFLFFVSLVPDRFRWVVEAVGFGADRAAGLALLRRCAGVEEPQPPPPPPPSSSSSSSSSSPSSAGAAVSLATHSSFQAPFAALLLTWITDFFLQDHTMALELVRAALERFPTGAVYQYLGAYVNRHRGDLLAAERAFSDVRAWCRAPASPAGALAGEQSRNPQLAIVGAYELGWTRLMRARFAEAAELLVEFLSLHRAPGYRAFAWFQLGVCRLMLQQPGEARHALEQVSGFSRKNYTWDEFAARKAESLVAQLARAGVDRVEDTPPSTPPGERAVDATATAAAAAAAGAASAAAADGGHHGDDDETGVPPIPSVQALPVDHGELLLIVAESLLDGFAPRAALELLDERIAPSLAIPAARVNGSADDAEAAAWAKADAAAFGTTATATTTATSAASSVPVVATTAAPLLAEGVAAGGSEGGEDDEDAVIVDRDALRVVFFYLRGRALRLAAKKRQDGDDDANEAGAAAGGETAATAAAGGASAGRTSSAPLVSVEQLRCQAQRCFARATAMREQAGAESHAVAFAHAEHAEMCLDHDKDAQQAHTNLQAARKVAAAGCDFDKPLKRRLERLADRIGQHPTAT